ncbi:hypothetical protein ACVIVD_006684 [Bradyrhizobium liaoningense]
MVGLGRKYPARLVEQACAHAIDNRIYRYKHVRATVERLFEQAIEQVGVTPQPASPLTQDHPLIRTPAEYGDLRAGPGCLDSAPLDLSGFLPGYAERGALRFCRCVGRA